LEKWYKDATHSARFKRLIFRVKHRAVAIGFEEMVRIVEENKLKLKEAMLEKSKLISRWLKRPMINCWDAWSEHCAELRRRDQMLKRLRFRMLNAGAVRAISEWQHLVRLQKEERKQLLYFAVVDAVKSGTMEELRAVMSSHAIWNLRYNHSLMQEAMQQLLARNISSIAHGGHDSSRSRVPTSHRNAPSRSRSSRSLQTSNSQLHSAPPTASIPEGFMEQQINTDTVTGTSIHALLLLVDHIDPHVRSHALRKLLQHMYIWKDPLYAISSDAKYGGAQFEMVMEDMPHADDVVAAVQQRLQDDTHAQVRDAAQALLTHYRARPAPSKIDKSCFEKRFWWNRINTPMSTLAHLHKDRSQHYGRGGVTFGVPSSKSRVEGDRADDKRGHTPNLQTSSNTNRRVTLEPLVHYHDNQSHDSAPLPTSAPAAVAGQRSLDNIRGDGDIDGFENERGGGGGGVVQHGYEDGSMHCDDVDLGDEVFVSSQMPFVLLQQPPSHHHMSCIHSHASPSLAPVHIRTADHIARSVEEGRKRVGSSKKGGGWVRDGGREGEEALPALKSEDKTKEKSRDQAWSGKCQETVSRSGGGGQASKWAQNFDFTNYQASRTQSLNQVKRTLSDFKSHLSSGMSANSRVYASAATHTRSHSSGWDDADRDGGGVQITSSDDDYSYRHGVRSMSVASTGCYGDMRQSIVREGIVGPRTPRISRFSRRNTGGVDGGGGGGCTALPRLSFTPSWTSSTASEWARVETRPNTVLIEARP
jgi:hypothetical protein